MPYVVLEGYATGTPVVATRVDGVLDLVEPGVSGVLCEIGSVESLAEAIADMLARSADERHAMGERGRRRVVERFTVERMVAGLEEVYRELV